MRIAVIDGLGGGLGSQIVDSLKRELKKPVELIVLGTNSNATSRMLNKGADRGATGENAIRITVRDVDIIVGPLGVIIPNSMSGEVTTVMAEAIADSSAKKFLIGVRQPHFQLLGLGDKSINELISNLTEEVKNYIQDTFTIK